MYLQGEKILVFNIKKEKIYDAMWQIVLSVRYLSETLSVLHAVSPPMTHQKQSSELLGFL